MDRKIYNPIQKDYVTFLKHMPIQTGNIPLLRWNWQMEAVSDFIITKPTVKNSTAWKEVQVQLGKTMPFKTTAIRQPRIPMSIIYSATGAVRLADSG